MDDDTRGAARARDPDEPWADPVRARLAVEEGSQGGDRIVTLDHEPLDAIRLGDVADRLDRVVWTHNTAPARVIAVPGRVDRHDSRVGRRPRQVEGRAD